MSLPLLVNNADCGPSNALQGLSKRFDQDRGIQQDQFASSRAGPSRETFRTQQTVHPDLVQEAARFFNASSGPQLASPAFDFSALNASLPGPQPQLQKPHAAASWAADFIQLGTASAGMASQTQSPHGQARVASPAQSQGPQLLNANAQWAGGRMYSPQMFSPATALQHQYQQHRPATQHDQVLWDREFAAVEPQISSSAPVHEQAQEAKPNQLGEPDELARTAALLLDTVRDVENPKFKNSEFMTLMRGLRDREVVVEGNEMVKNANPGQASAPVDVKGKGRAMDTPMGGMSMPIDPSGSNVFGRVRQREKHQEEIRTVEEDPNEAYFRQENQEYQYYWAEAQNREAARQDNVHWDKLQQDWDNFEATNTGIRPVDRYMFQRNNPYLSGSPATRTRHHLAHQGREAFLESVLELEAAVQRNMTDASAWYDLGVKQQANERETQALQALRRALELDPSHLPSWLALAISHTNNGDRVATAEAISQWVDKNARYRSAVTAFRANHSPSPGANTQERYNALIQCLISMARSDTSGEVDADIQIALAVLLNSNEDYEKAQDCFRSALAVRPDDWLLYNRVGATMANSGRAEEALQYYHRALELNPLYIRARYNLGISCINLRRFDDAAHHVLDALGLQESDGVSSGVDTSGGVTTAALWDSLRTTSLNLHRPDLAAFCDERDLEGFRKSFR
ncbi:hypothetical protein MKEN_00692700 [Mycena kentingensis (nom. inval.)]|nr:hypothetical protein MKEN_00692700 [Mycena kentingensis (nom. inval.)]